MLAIVFATAFATIFSYIKTAKALVKFPNVPLTRVNEDYCRKATWSAPEIFATYLLREDSQGFIEPPTDFPEARDYDPEIFLPISWIRQADQIREVANRPPIHEIWCTGNFYFGHRERFATLRDREYIARFNKAVRAEISQDLEGDLESRANASMVRFRHFLSEDSGLVDIDEILMPPPSSSGSEQSSRLDCSQDSLHMSTSYSNPDLQAHFRGPSPVASCQSEGASTASDEPQHVPPPICTSWPCDPKTCQRSGLCEFARSDSQPSGEACDVSQLANTSCETSVPSRETCESSDAESEGAPVPSTRASGLYECSGSSACDGSPKPEVVLDMALIESLERSVSPEAQLSRSDSSESDSGSATGDKALRLQQILQTCRVSREEFERARREAAEDLRRFREFRDNTRAASPVRAEFGSDSDSLRSRSPLVPEVANRQVANPLAKKKKNVTFELPSGDIVPTGAVQDAIDDVRNSVAKPEVEREQLTGPRMEGYWFQNRYYTPPEDLTYLDHPKVTRNPIFFGKSLLEIWHIRNVLRPWDFFDEELN